MSTRLTADDAEDHGDDDDQDEERQRNDQHKLHPVSLRNTIKDSKFTFHDWQIACAGFGQILQFARLSKHND